MERKYKRNDRAGIDPFKFIDHVGTYAKGIGVGSILVEPKDSYYLYRDTRCGKIVKDHNLVRSCPDCDRPREGR